MALLKVHNGKILGAFAKQIISQEFHVCCNCVTLQIGIIQISVDTQWLHSVTKRLQSMSLASKTVFWKIPNVDCELMSCVVFDIIGEMLSIAAFMCFNNTWNAQFIIFSPNQIFSIDLCEIVSSTIFELIDFTRFGTSEGLLRHPVRIASLEEKFTLAGP